MRGTVKLRQGALPAARAEAGLSQAKLAKATGLSHGIIAFYETGDRQPSADALQRLAAALGCDIVELLDEAAA
jgi:transcriptional regulator with XRE-family HTH domain